MLIYRQQPTLEERTRLEAQFDTLFTTKTGYWALDERIVLTSAKKASLLMVLEHPEIPLHNNAAELAARQRVRKRKISSGPRVAEGTRAWDTFMSLAGTTKKLGANLKPQFGLIPRRDQLGSAQGSLRKEIPTVLPWGSLLLLVA